MTEANLNELQPELDLGEEREALALRMAEIDRQIAERATAARTDALKTVLAAIKQHSFTAAELGLAVAPKVKTEKIKVAGAKVAAKYRDHVSGAEWTGRGKAPNWLAGRDKDEFLIRPAGENGAPAATDPS